MLPPKATGSLFLLTGVSILHLSSLHPTGDVSELDITPGPSRSGDVKDIIAKHSQKMDDDVLFGDIEPQQLANILVKALRRKDKHRREDGRDNDEVESGRPQELHTKTPEQEEDKDTATEDVTSHTIIQTLEVPTKSPSVQAQFAEAEEPKLETLRQEEEEQLTAEELHSLETMMKEFPRVGTFEKRDDSSSFNEVLPVNKKVEQKLKWQEETQKAMHFPSFHFMDELKMNSLVDDLDTTDLQQDATEEMQQPGEQSPEEADEEILSPEEEEAQAKAEQDEMRRQAAEAQRARMEEKKLADIASDMLLRYMGKERSSSRFSSSLSDAPEDKRSDEQAQDLDPQTIDKLIEISSKLHLPADDVVDIISDVEKKKRKDVPPETSSRYSSNAETEQPISSRVHSWFHPKLTASQDLWSKPRKPQPGRWSQNAPEGRLKPLAFPVPYYHRYPPAYYPFPAAPPRPRSWYYNPYTLNRFLTNPVSSYASNAQTHPASGWRLLRKPVPYYTNGATWLNPWRFKVKAPPSRAVARQKQWSASRPKSRKTSSNRREGLERTLQQFVRKEGHLYD
ncbi:uncharacterized protein vgf [Eucyclogobius newberryi]|uniref:uncharacterized protein vgf n=1 Tax=Eucyclogobius newberryi TaxID=166745 RepID=UPI003B5BE30F